MTGVQTCALPILFEPTKNHKGFPFLSIGFLFFHSYNMAKFNSTIRNNQIEQLSAFLSGTKLTFHFLVFFSFTAGTWNSLGIR